MPAQRICKVHLLNYLHYLQHATGQRISARGMTNWAALDNDEEIRAVLDKFYERTGIGAERGLAYEAAFLRPAPAAPTVTAPRRRTWLGALLAGLVLAGLAGWVYQHYRSWKALQSQGYVYALTDNIAVRRSASSTAATTGRMVLFGRNHRGETTTGFLQLAALEPVQHFYAVIDSFPSFTAYLIHGKADIAQHTRYVHQDFTTRDAGEYNRYVALLSGLQYSYGDLHLLTFRYRKLLADAAQKFPGNFQGQQVTTTCGNVPYSTPARQDAYYSLYCLQSDDSVAVAFRLSNGKYYYAVADKKVDFASIRITEIPLFEHKRISFNATGNGDMYRECD